MNKMKRKSIICMMLLSMMLGMFSTSCQDMLSPNSERHAYTVAQDTLYSYWGILRSLQDIAERYVILNECRGDLVDETSFVSDTIGAIINFGKDVQDPEKWKDGACAYLKISDYYHVINSCNAYIAMCDTTRTTGTNQSYMVKELAQVHAIRAWVYMQLLYAYGENRVPFYTKPMLTTDDINSFVSDNNSPKLTADILKTELAPDLEVLEKYELNSEYGLPGYNYYGDVNDPICHSSKCMFPIPIVLGDLYLLSGDYIKSATHYFEYIKTDKCGSLLVDDYRSTGDLDDKVDYPIYNYDSENIPYLEYGAVSKSTESITCIPSNEGKLSGRVLTDICRLFGFEAELTSSKMSYTIEIGGESTEGTLDYNRVYLNRNYERELIPSRGYEALCDSQKYEIYVGTSGNGGAVTIDTLETLPGVGDARRAWIYYSGGQQWNFWVGDNRLYGKMVTKQSPMGSFSCVYPIVYRKSTVWLRYAEAMNRAGFPAYAFAVLKNGLCSNPNWFPENPKDVYSSKELFGLKQAVFDYPVTDTLYCYVDDVTGDTIPKGWQKENQVKTIADLEVAVNAYFQQEFADYNVEHPEAPMTEARTADLTGDDAVDANLVLVRWQPASETAFGNVPAVTGACACYYIGLKELERAGNTPYMNFKQVPGQKQNQRIYYKEQGRLFLREKYSLSFPTDTDPTILYTMGVHQRGCGAILYDDPVEYGRSTFNYVKLVQKKVKENNGLDLSEEDIYSGNYEAQIQDAVEDLIIDEMGLELAFEGTRFSDLYRVAQRRGNPDYLAERVSKRHTGEVDPSLRAWLNDKNNWFLPIPQE